MRLLPSPRFKRVRSCVYYLCWCLGIGLGYFLIGTIMLSFSSPHIALIWPSAGIALWALLFKGWRLWPGVLLGSLATNLNDGVAFLCALGISFGASLAALTGWYLLVQVRHHILSAGAIQILNNFIIFGCAIPTIVSAAIGSGSLLGFGLIDPDALLGSFGLWWLGDATGALCLGWLMIVIMPPHFEIDPTN